MRATRREVFGAMVGLAAGSSALGASQARPVAQKTPAAQPPLSPVGPVTLADYEPLAKRRMSHMAYEYVVGGAGDELTLRENNLAFDRIRLQPRILLRRLQPRPPRDALRPVARTPDPARADRLPSDRSSGRRDWRPSTARSRPKRLWSSSSFATTSIEDMRRGREGGSLWFQLYVNRDRGFTRDLVQRAESAGCRALCVTVDSPTTASSLSRNARVRFALPRGHRALESQVTYRPPGRCIARPKDRFTTRCSTQL